MAVKEIFDVVKQNPALSATGLFVAMLVGAFGGAIYVKASEQRLAVMEERLKKQEEISKKQKNVMEVITTEFSELKQNVRSLSSNLGVARDAAHKHTAGRSSSASFAKDISQALAALETDVGKVERSVSQSEAITKAFSTLLSAVRTGRDLDSTQFVSDITGQTISQANISNVGLPVPGNELQPGDLVFFNTMRRAFSHVGIYIGDGKFVGAPSPGGEAKVDDLRKSYWTKRFEGARRVETSQKLVHDLAAVLAEEVSGDATVREPSRRN